MPAVLGDDDLARVHGVDERISVENLRRATIATYEIVRRLAQ
jgi:acetylornithine deacetylase/succinyl-diaminopimelate desuccinylase-like protein